MAATAIAVIASSQASIAQSQARDAECRVVLEIFDSSSKPTINEQREYAGCVYRIHGSGEPLTSGEVMAWKAIIIIAIIGACIGIYKARQDPWSSGFDYFTLAFLGALGLPLVLAILGGAAYGIYFLFT
jgi:hypothetical protein